MKLGEIRQYIKNRGESTLADVAIHFDISKAAAKFALDYWMNKGIIQSQAATCSSSCSSCKTGCGSSTANSTESNLENYAWVNRETKIHWL